MKKIWIILGIIGAVLVLFLLVSAINSKNSSKTATGEAIISDDKSNEDKLTQIIEESYTSEEKNIELTLHTIAYSDEIAWANLEKEGNHYLIANISVKNMGRLDERLGNPLSFTLYTDKGWDYCFALSTLNIPAGHLDLTKTTQGESAEGLIAFEIPKDETPTTLEYETFYGKAGQEESEAVEIIISL